MTQTLNRTSNTSFMNNDVRDERLSRHYMATITTRDINPLLDVESFSKALHKVLKKEGVRCLGQVNHSFPNRSFTSVVGLAESHISVHTWPERRTVQLDVFLCNYINDNRDKCERIFTDLVKYFDAEDVDVTYIDRR